MAYVPPLNGGRMNLTISSNTAGAGALISTGTLTLAGGSNITLSQNNANAITIHGAAGGAGGTQTLGMSNLGNTSGTTGVITGSAVSMAFAGGNNITLSQSLNGSSGTITISAFNQSNQNVSLYALGNTTQNSSTLLNASNLSYNGLGAVTMGYSNGSIQVSAPATSSLQGTGIVNISSNGSTVSIGAPAFSAGISTGGNTSNTSGVQTGQLVFAGGNNVTLSQSNNNGSATITIVGGAGGGVAISGTNAAITSGTASLSATGAVSISVNGQVVSIGAPTQTNQTLSQAVTGNTTGNTSGMSVDARSLTLQGLGIVSAGISTSAGGSSLIVSATQSNQALSGSNGAFNFQTATFGSSNGMHFYTTNGSMVGSYTVPNVPAQTNQTLSQAVTGNTTGNTSGMSMDARSLTLQGLGIVSAGISTSAGGSSLILSATQSVQTANLYVVGNTSQLSTTAGVDLRTLSFEGAGVASIGVSQGKVLINVPSGGGGIALSGTNAAITSGTASLSATGAASISVNGQTVSIGAAVQTNQTIGYYINGNTAGTAGGGSTSSNPDARSVTISASGGLSAGWSSNSKLLISAPDVSSLNVAGQLTMSTNGTNISLGVPQATIYEKTLGLEWYSTTNVTGLTYSNIYMFPARFDEFVSGSLIKIPIQVTHSSSAFGAHTRGYTALLGVYTRNSTNSTVLSRHYSTSYTAGFFGSTSRTMSVSVITGLGNSTSYNTSTYTDNQSALSSIVSGNRELMIAFASNVTPGEYWFAFHQSSSSGGAAGNLFILSHPLFSWGTASTYSPLGVSTATSYGVWRQNSMGFGSYSTSSNAMPAGISMTQINSLGYFPQMYFINSTI